MQLDEISESEYEQLKADTAEDRKLIDYSCPQCINSRIKKLVRLLELKHEDPIMIYLACYHIGYVDGKRAERQKRKGIK